MMATPQRDDTDAELTAVHAVEPEEGYTTWKMAEIEQARQEEDAGDFATDDEVRELFHRWSDAGIAARNVSNG